jgi:hypothetical protein
VRYEGQRYEAFQCDVSWRIFSFLKLTSGDGVVGWSEFNESFDRPALSSVIAALMPTSTSTRRDYAHSPLVALGNTHIGCISVLP